MKQLLQGFFQDCPLEKLTKTQINEAILYIDTYIYEEPEDSAEMIQYCLLKIDLINKLIVLDNNKDLFIH
ncbi:hypothetical protein [Adhaeribacter radiodurans]|uniref:Uncharacterized protein n=1 Tax=Adhaeribacter radiodurans TaxID=2745197 RepID=A0A7L7L7K4_9BACT|nr:hypothetical protein [Adhaeribacter radiodurans]QMU28349.1 hypothetical protein HUW48_10025 [Adhaeribacter radiodurans]